MDCHNGKLECGGETQVEKGYKSEQWVVRWDGIRILDLTQVQAGPSCTQLLAWLGGEVIEIEEPGVGHQTRKELAHDPDSDSFYFLVFNANKKSMCLNLESEDGVRKFKELARTVDVVVENFGPGGLDRFDLEYEQVRALNPRIIYACIRGLGTYGLYTGHKAFESIVQAMSTNRESGANPSSSPSGSRIQGRGCTAP